MERRRPRSPGHRRRVAFKAVTWTVSLLAAALLATRIVIVSATNIVEEEVRQIILDEASEAIDGELEIADIDINYLPLRVTANDVSLAHPAHGKFLDAEAVEISIDVVSLLTDEIRLSEVALIRPRIHLLVEDGRVVNLPAIETKEEQKTVVILESLNVTNGRVTASVEETAPWPVDLTISGLGVDVTGDENEMFEVRILAGGGEVTAGDVERTIDRLELRTTVDLRGGDLELTVKYVNLDLPDATLAARDGKLEWSEETGLDVRGKLSAGLPLVLVSSLMSDLPPLEGTLECQGEGGYGASGWNADARCEGREISVKRRYIGDLDLEVVADQDVVRVEEGSVRQAGGELRFASSLDISSESLDIDFDGEADGLRFAELATNVGLKGSRVQFTVTGPIGVSGSLRPIDLEGHMDWSVSNFRVSDFDFRHHDGGGDIVALPSGRIRGPIAVDEAAFTFKNVTVSTGSTILRTRAVVGFDETLDIRVDAQQFHGRDFQRLADLGLAASGTFVADISGSMNGPSIDARLDLDGVELVGYAFGSVEGRLQMDVRNSVMTLSDFNGRIGKSRYRIPSASITFRKKHKGGLLLEGEVLAEEVHLADLRRIFSLSDPYSRSAECVLTGKTVITIEPDRKPDRLFLEAEAVVTELVVSGEHLGDGLFQLAWDSGRLDLQRLELNGGVGRIDISGSMDPERDEPLDFDVHVTELRSERIRAKDLEAMGVGFIADLDAHIGGSTEKPSVSGGLLLFDDVTYKDQDFGRLAVEIDLADQLLSLTAVHSRTRIALFSQTVTSDRWPTTVEIRLEDLRLGHGPLGLGKDSGARATITGLIDAHLTLAGGFTAEGEMDLSSVDVEMQDYGLENEGHVVAGFTQEDMRFEQVRFVGEGTRIELSGGLVAEGPRIQVDGAADLGLLQRFVPELDVAVGTLRPKVSVTGTWSRIDVNGSLKVTCDELRISGFPIDFSEIDGQASFTEGAVALDASGNAERGTFSLSGGVKLDGFSLSGYDVFTDFNDVAFDILDDTPVTMEGRLALQGAVGEEEKPLLSGDVWLSRFRYKKNFKLASMEDLGVVKPTPKVATYDEKKEHVRLDVGVHGYENLSVTNNIADVEFRIDENQQVFRVVGTDARPVFVGSIMVTKGTVVWQKKTFEVTRGVLDFTNLSRTEPHFEIIAVGDVREWRLTLMASGTPDDFKVLFSSDPVLSDEDIVCLLATDMTCDEAMQGFSYIGTYGLNALLGQFAEVEQFRVVPVYDPDTGKAEPMLLYKQKLTEQFSVSALSSLTSNLESGQSAYVKTIIEYEVNDNLSIEGSYDTKHAGQGSNMGNFGVDLSWSLEF